MADVLGHSVEEFLALEPEEVGMLILARLQLEPTWKSGAVSAWNFNLEIQQAARDAGAPGEAMQAGAVALEGWQWLRANGFLAQDPNQHAEWEKLTRAGRATNPRAYLAQTRGMGILRGAKLDDELRRTVDPLMIRGKYDDAVMAAMRLVEDRVRFAGRFSNSDIGTKLMKSAFGASGNLRDPKLDVGEATARMELFAGAIGVFKNPASHRIVGSDQNQAIEVILLANTLLRLLAGAEKATRRRGRPRIRS